MKNIREQIIYNALVCAVTFYDENSKISPSLSARVHEVFGRITDILKNECDLNDNDFIRILNDHKDIAFFNEVIGIISEKISDSGIAHLNNEMIFLAEFGRILPYRGKNYHNLSDKSECESETAYLITKNDSLEIIRCSVPKVAVVLCFRIDCEERLRNLMACIYSIRMQNFGKEMFYITAVNQDKEDKYRDLIEKYVDKYIFAENPSTYNYAWARNIGANSVPDAEILVFWDIDIIAGKSMLTDIYSAFSDKELQGVVPYTSAYNLDAVSSSAALVFLTSENTDEIKENSYSQIMHEVYGMLIATRSDIFHRIGGQDERYEGWGDEDNDFYQRLYLNGKVRRLEKDIFHLDHPRPIMRIDGEKINRKFIGDLKSGGESIGNIKKYSMN